MPPFSLGIQTRYINDKCKAIHPSRDNGGVGIRFNDLRQSKFSVMAGEHLSKTIEWGGTRVEVSNTFPRFFQRY